MSQEGNKFSKKSKHKFCKRALKSNEKLILNFRSRNNISNPFGGLAHLPLPKHHPLKAANPVSTDYTTSCIYFPLDLLNNKHPFNNILIKISFTISPINGNVSSFY